MFAGLVPYDSYQARSSPWLEKVPSHWRLARVKSVLHERVAKGYPEEPLLAATQSQGVIRKSDYGNRTVTATKDLHLLKLVEDGDFVISLRSFQGGIERCYHRGIISPAYTVLTATSDTYRDFLTYLFKSKPFVNSLTLAVTGIREGQNIDYSQLAVELLPVPPAAEQVVIVKYLTHANARIDKAIAAKRRLIALVNEEKQAVARELLTSGSGEIGRVPGHWQSVISKRLCRITTGAEDSGNAAPDGEYPFFVRGREILRSSDYLFDAEAVMTPGDGQGGVGKVFHYYHGKFQAHQRVYVFLNFKGVRARYFYWYLSTFFRSYALSQSNTVTMESLRQPVLASFPVSFPSIREQLRLVEQIEAETYRMQDQVDVAQREIALLGEFRARLVADVVTGQADVRAIAASLPEIDPDAPTPDPLADGDLIVEDAMEMSEVRPCG